MADATLGAPGEIPAGSMDGRTVYQASGGRRTTFSFVFLLLLPFFASLPAMLYMRFSHGLPEGTIGLIVLALCFAVLMLLVVVELIFALRARIELGDTVVRATLPAGRGPTPFIRYATHEVPYDQIAAVETRREIYGGALAPVMLRGARILTKDGKAIRLGYDSEANDDPCFPYVEIARKIAARAGVPLIDKGSVRRSVQKKMMGIKASEEENLAVDDAAIATLNVRHRRFVLGLIGTLVALVCIGIAIDVMNATTYRPAAAAVGKKG